MSRKTVSIEWLRNKTNEFLALSDPEMVEMRKGAAALLESALFETDNYGGFRYQSTEWDSEKGCLRDGYDDSRREYFRKERG